MWLENTGACIDCTLCKPGFNPSSSGCGWKTSPTARITEQYGLFQSFFFWMWLENGFFIIMCEYLMRCFNPSSSGCGWKTYLTPLISHIIG